MRGFLNGLDGDHFVAPVLRRQAEMALECADYVKHTSACISFVARHAGLKHCDRLDELKRVTVANVNDILKSYAKGQPPLHEYFDIVLMAFLDAVYDTGIKSDQFDKYMECVKTDDAPDYFYDVFVPSHASSNMEAGLKVMVDIVRRDAKAFAKKQEKKRKHGE